LPFHVNSTLCHTQFLARASLNLGQQHYNTNSALQKQLSITKPAQHKDSLIDNSTAKKDYLKLEDIYYARTT